LFVGGNTQASNAFSLNPQGKPFNPFTTTGGIVQCAIVDNKQKAERFDAVQNFFSELASQRVEFSNTAYTAYNRNCERERALAYFMAENGVFPREDADADDLLDLFLQTSSLEVSVSAIAKVAALLANGGVSPTSGKRLVDGITVKNLMSLLLSCGECAVSFFWNFVFGTSELTLFGWHI
jgi:glutaminase